MFTRAVCIAALALGALAVSAHAQSADEGDDIVRLPGQGLVKTDAFPGRKAPERLVPGGGLMMSFDVDGDGRISTAELTTGAKLAFAAADINEDGALTALEQQAWASNLPTRYDTLANPVRFDPNLDRTVSEAEFSSVIVQLASAYSEASSGDILLASLTAPERPRERDRGIFGERRAAPDIRRR